VKGGRVEIEPASLNQRTSTWGAAEGKEYFFRSGGDLGKAAPTRKPHIYTSTVIMDGNHEPGEEDWLVVSFPKSGKEGGGLKVFF